METIALDLDFTNVSTAGGLGILPAGLHQGTIVEFKYFEDSNRLYAYILTDGIRHRESFGLANPKTLPFVKAFLVSAGVDESKLQSSGKIPFHKFTGRTVYFQYTPAEVDSSGQRKDGSYARYVFYPKAQWDQMSAWSPVVSDEDSSADFEVEAAAPKAEEKPSAAPAAGDDYDFLIDDE
tara:strand:+ start:12544 stop:13083 length:540 start_codon:yes stop_codon:yes gene_type:complete